MKTNGGETVTIYVKKHPFCAEEGSGLTILEAERAFQLLPDPPKVETLNDYIVTAVNGDENGFPFFLHAYEERLNTAQPPHSRFSSARGFSEYRAGSPVRL